MNQKRLLITMLSLLMLNALSLSTHYAAALPLSPYIAVTPSSTTISSFPQNNRNCTVSINTDYHNLTEDNVWGYNVYLTFSPAVLECIEVRNGDLITTTKDPSARFFLEINNTSGEVSAGAFFYYTIPPPYTTNGPGTLAIITFRVLSSGTSSLTLERDTKLQGFNFGTDKVYNIISAGLQPKNIGHGTVAVTIGDVNSDQTVNVADVLGMSNAYGSTAGPPPSPNWNPNCDFHGNGKIEVLDLFYQGRNYGKSW